ncbi:hypothetical protein SK128_003457 [Halocaridina rubra]|uniref:Uncharacterized protein n=1 Tax=Halocaridina rubra TaxID=373956 RepID=A0AAN9A2N0_HALRR
MKPSAPKNLLPLHEAKRPPGGAIGHLRTSDLARKRRKVIFLKRLFRETMHETYMNLLEVSYELLAKITNIMPEQQEQEKKIPCTVCSENQIIKTLLCLPQ